MARVFPLFSLPNEILLSALCSRFPCRNQQIQSLATLLSIRGAPCKNIVLHGLNATGKSTITKALLEELSLANVETTTKIGGQPDVIDELRYAIIKSAECISGRHLFEQTIGAVAKAVQWTGNIGRGESISQLVVEVGKIMEGWTALSDESGKRRLVLVFDGIDNQREAAATLLPALARMGEIIPNLTTLYIVTAPRPNFLHLPGAPHVHFPAYTKVELLEIAATIKPTPQLPTGAENTTNVWSRFCPAVYDSLTKHSGRDIISFQALCARLWPRFIQPILDGTHEPVPFGRLLIANRSLFQDDSVLVPNIISKPNTVKLNSNTQSTALSTQLPFHTRVLLLASYLASFNPVRTDITHFMKSAISKRRKKGGGTALTKNNSILKHRKISRKLLGAQSFSLERMLAIFACLREDAYSSTLGKKKVGKRKGGREDVNGSADIHTAIATLASLRLIVKIGAANAGDTLDGGCRYRVAVGWEVVRGIGRSVGVEMEDYLAE